MKDLFVFLGCVVFAWLLIKLISLTIILLGVLGVIIVFLIISGLAIWLVPKAWYVS